MDRRTLLRGTGLALVGMTAISSLPSITMATTTANKTDESPLINELVKYPRCVICNMDRRQFHFSRHLLHYSDDHVQGTCSINCASEAMLRERKRGFSAIYAADYSETSDPKPLIEASTATYLIGSSLKAVMSPISKYAFATQTSAEIEMAKSGGQLATFEKSLAAALKDYANILYQQYRKDQQG